MSGFQTHENPGVPTIEVSPSESDFLYQIPKKYPDGVNVRLTRGRFLISKTVCLPSNTSIIGAGREKTEIVLARKSNCHLFTNADHHEGNADLAFRHFSVDGNGEYQDRPDDHQSATFCCAIYLRRCLGVEINDCSFFDVRQTAAHFSECLKVSVRRMRSHKLGWSGVSTSGTSQIWVEAMVSDAGRDQLHSAIHVDGGVGVYVDAEVSDTTGNGIMLDSTYSPLLHAVAKGSATRCLRGVMLSGSAEKELRYIYIEGRFISNSQAGVMVSNAQNVVIARSVIENNGMAGVRFQGRNGGRDCLVIDSYISGSPVPYEQLHASGNNWIFEPPSDHQAVGAFINAGTRASIHSASVSADSPMRWRLIE